MRIVIADDHTLVTDGLCRCFEPDPEFEVCGTAENGDELLALVKALNPDVALVDITMPGMNGIEAVRFVSRDPEVQTRCVILSMHREREFVSAAFKNGARGYLLKSSSFAELKDALRAVMREEKYICPRIAEVFSGKMEDVDATVSPLLSQLTPRERQTLQLLSEGLSVKEIGTKLGINFKTVHTFRASLMQKLECGSVAELTRLAIRHGMTNLD